MNISVLAENNTKFAVADSNQLIIKDIQSAIDFIATVRYTTPCDIIIIEKSAVSEDFFDLKTGLAGEVLQKFVNYRMSIAITGDFSVYTSTSLKEFMYECNKGRLIHFASNRKEAIEFFALHDR